MTGAPATSRTGAMLGLAAVLVLGAALFFLLTRAYPLERSAIGFDGLGTWLARSGVAVKRLPPAPDDPEGWVTLRVLPIYDNDIGDTIFSSESDETLQRLGSLSPRSMSRAALEARLLGTSTLVVLPKWREGIVRRGRAHPSLLIPADLIGFLYDDEEVVRRPEGEPFQRLQVEDTGGGASPGSVTLYEPQVLGATFEESCEARWEVAGVGTLLAFCDGFSPDGSSFYVLSDPDILDNHGLALGDNAAVAVAMMRLLAPNAPVYVDPGGETAPVATAQEENFADPSRFFRYPFTLVWLGVALLFLFAFWRGNVRFGFPATREAVRGFRSKHDTIRASGRLMRLAGGGNKLIAAYATARLETLSDMLLGRAARGDAPSAVIRFLHQRAPESGARLEASYRDLVAGAPGEGRPPAALDSFESVFQEILDEFGRASRPSRRDRA